ncbi:MAG: hypothetical protein ACPGQS_02780 [Bradymonadia bacterium]
MHITTPANSGRFKFYAWISDTKGIRLSDALSAFVVTLMSHDPSIVCCQWREIVRDDGFFAPGIMRNPDFV